MAARKMSFTSSHGTRFNWTVGGEYIDVTFPGSTTAMDVINVWDYEASHTTIEHTREAFTRECRRYDRELSDHDRQQFILAGRMF